jgi:cytochrome c oxidase subunit 3
MSTDDLALKEHHPAHHFDDAHAEFDAAKLGIWLFLATEIMMFGGLFVGYIYYHGLYPVMFEAGAKFLDWKLGALNTIILLISSFTMAASIHYISTDQIRKGILNMWLTVACGGGFLIVKYFEYAHKIHDGLLPGKLYAHAGENLGLYFSFYFCMTGLHGSHVILGMVFIAICAIRAQRGHFGSKYFTPVEGAGLFWHLVDLIWIYLFPLLYLVG